MAGAALAEGEQKESLGTLNVNNAFDIRCRMPEGYKLSILSSDGTSVLALVSSEEAGKPQLSLSIAFNDMFTAEDGTALRLNDVSDEGIEFIKNSFQDQMAEGVTFEDGETALGTRLLIVKGAVDENTHAVIFYSVYQSYEIELVATMGMDDDGDLTEEQTQMIIDFLTGLDFVPAA